MNVVSATFPSFSESFFFPSSAVLSNHATNLFVSSFGVGAFGSATAGVAAFACSQVRPFLTS